MNAESSASRLHLQRVRVEGRVQGVGFREFCVREARALGLAGWVRNRHDGSVELLLHGDAEQLATMHARLRAGPPAARVLRVDVEDAAGPVPSGFERRQSA